MNAPTLSSVPPLTLADLDEHIAAERAYIRAAEAEFCDPSAHVAGLAKLLALRRLMTQPMRAVDAAEREASGGWLT